MRLAAHDILKRASRTLAEGQNPRHYRTMSVTPALVSAAWLDARRTEPSLRVIDASWYLPQMGRDARAEYLERHVPGAVFAGLEALCDPEHPLPHMLPTAEQFAAVAGARLGVTADTHVVVYDASGVNLSAARAWWSFRVFGHPRVSVLDGGLGAWLAAGYPAERGDVAAPPAVFPNRGRRDDLVRSLDDIRRLVAASPGGASAQLVDVRPADRFRGEVPEPRAGVRPGRMPGSRNLPFAELVDRATGMALQGAALRTRMEAAGVDPAQPVVATCGSGVTACALALALHTLGAPDTAVYDGSWTEWGGQPDTPAERG